MNELTVNEIPSKTWSWLKMNKARTEAAGEILEKSIKPENLNQNGLSFLQEDLKDTVPVPQGAELSEKKSVYTLSDRDFSSMIKNSCKTENRFTVSGTVEQPVIINLAYRNGEKSASVQKIFAEAGSKASFIFVYSSEKNSQGTSYISTEIHADSGAEISIVKVQLLGKDFNQIDNTTYFVKENASVKLNQVELGGKEIYSSVHTNLTEYKSEFYSQIAYYLKDSQKLDMNHVCWQLGKKTDCKMYVNGSLKDNSMKTYRGTIDFKNGCSGSTGDEQEQVLVLSTAAVNNSIPVILCDEEDVSGEHGASIGRLSDEILFYMKSRGISKEEAENIIARAKVQACASAIPDEKTVSLISDFMDSIFGD